MNFEGIEISILLSWTVVMFVQIRNEPRKYAIVVPIKIVDAVIMAGDFNAQIHLDFVPIRELRASERRHRRSHLQNGLLNQE